MNDYVSRSELSPVERTAPRAASPVPAVQPVSASRQSADRQTSDTYSTAPLRDGAAIDDDVASAAEYAKVHVEIADILADLRSAGAIAPGVDAAADAIQSLMPVPIILVPLPPASKEAVEHAAVIARRMVEQAAYAHAAQAQLRRGTVDQVLASAN